MSWSRTCVSSASSTPWRSIAGPDNPSDLRYGPSTTSNSLLAGLAVPDANRVSFHRDLAAECAGVACVLCDFHLLDLLSEGGTISDRTKVSPVELRQLVCLKEAVVVDRIGRIPGTVFTGHSDL